MSNPDYKALYEQLQKETNDKLRKQDHTVNKHKKIKSILHTQLIHHNTHQTLKSQTQTIHK